MTFLRINIYLNELAFFFEFLVNSWLEEMAESHVNKAPHSDRFNDANFFLKCFTSLFHGKPLPIPTTTDHFARQNSFNAELLDISILWGGEIHLSLWFIIFWAGSNFEEPRYQVVIKVVVVPDAHEDTQSWDKDTLNASHIW